jgi:hypothetical protein
MLAYSDPGHIIGKYLSKEEKNRLLTSSSAKVTSPNDQSRSTEQAMTEFKSNLFFDIPQSKAKLIELFDNN